MPRGHALRNEVCDGQGPDEALFALVSFAEMTIFVVFPPVGFSFAELTFVCWFQRESISTGHLVSFFC